MKYLIIGLLFSLSTTVFAQENPKTSDPWAYAEEQASSFEGDTGLGHFDGCVTQPSASGTISIDCYGTAQQLMFGGYPVNSEYTCWFDFLKTRKNTYEVTFSDCRFSSEGEEHYGEDDNYVPEDY